MDAIVAAGNAAPTPADAIDLFQQAETILVQELPAIPMWFDHWEAVHSNNVDQFVWSLFNGPEYGLTTLQ